MIFRFDINALRAIAVISVILYHTDASLVPGGFAGVDIFFVISGYLMTGVIVEKLWKDEFSYSVFLYARARRIVPALASLCLTLLVMGWFLSTPAEYKSIAQSASTSLLFFSNVLYYLQSGYFTASAHENWLLHTWSLSVEWQFYILYPLVILGITKALGKNIKALVFCLLLLILISVIISAFFFYRSPIANFYLLPSRAWELLVGAVVYFFPTIKSGRVRSYVNLCALIVIFFSLFLSSSESGWPNITTVGPVIGTVLVILAADQHSYIFKNPVIKNVGLWSYSLYLWHWPMIVFLHQYYSVLSAQNYVVYCLILFLIAYVSYHLVERRFRTMRNIRTIIYASSVCFVFIIIISLDGVISPIRPASYSEQADYESMYSRDNYLDVQVKSAYMLQCDFYNEDNSTTRVKISDQCIDDKKNGMPSLFIWGDSHAQALSYGLRMQLSGRYNVSQVATSGCDISLQPSTHHHKQLRDACDRSNKFAIETIKKIKPDIVIMVQRLSHDRDEFNVIAEMMKYDGIKRVILVGPVPQWDIPLPVIISRRHWDVDTTAFADRALDLNIINVDANAKKRFTNSHELEYLSLLEQLCSSRSVCLAKVDQRNTPLVWDYGHLTLAGSEYIAKKIVIPFIEHTSH